ncbi:MAG: precorrin-2 C(20)-methyltransferase [Acutalibacteraceae bacterium]|nr:precorrin-2 C(20)-methyltransferase [Acutalibacteraceae bacterium]
MAELRGICYSIGVGPGDPELLTLKALRTMEQCGVVAAPRTKGGHMLALDIAQQAMDLSDKEILPLSFPMTNDQKERKRAHAAAAGEIAAYLDRGEDVAMLTLGDPSVYATSSYVCRLLEEQGYRTETIAGVPSFCAASAALSRELVQDGEPLIVIPASAGFADMERMLDLPGTKVIMKSGRQLPKVLELLRKKDLLSATSLAENVGLPGERILREPDENSAGEAGYFVTLIVRGTGR